MPADAFETLADRRAARRLASVFLLLSFALSLALLSVRNLYDDEQANIGYLGLPAARILAIANRQDVHPPGQYLLTSFAWQLIPSVRWMTLPALVLLYAGLAAFCLGFAPLLRTGRARVCFLLLACLHPELLMWGNTVRWYAWWTGLALLTLVLALQPAPPGRARLSLRRAAALGLLVAALFYLNYVTLLFLPALLAAIFWRMGRPAWRGCLLMLVLATALAAPQLHPMLTVHLRQSHGQRSSLLLSAGRLAQGLFASEAYLPWHPLAIVALLAGFCVLALALRRAARRLLRDTGRTRRRLPHSACASLLLFATILAMLLAGSGLGGKPRSALLLLPAFAPAAALLAARLRPPVLGSAGILFYALWSAGGIAHLLLRQGLAKGSMIDRPEELLADLRHSPPPPDSCRVLITYDNPLTLDLVLAHLPRTAVLTTTQIPLYRAALTLPPHCARFHLIWVTSYLDRSRPEDRVILADLSAAQHRLPPSGQSKRFSHDPDAAMKRRLAWLTGVANLPDDRFVTRESPATPAEYAAILQLLGSFAPADGRTLPPDDEPTTRHPGIQTP